MDILIGSLGILLIVGIVLLSTWMENKSEKKEIILPSNRTEFDCIISTPNFKHNQVGTFNKETLLFSHHDLLNGHDVQFKSIDEFKSSLLMILEPSEIKMKRIHKQKVKV